MTGLVRPIRTVVDRLRRPRGIADRSPRGIVATFPLKSAGVKFDCGTLPFAPLPAKASDGI